MKVCKITRETIYQLLDIAFKHLEIRPRIAELGVLKGQNAQRMMDILQPEKLVLVDSWSPHFLNEDRERNSKRPWVADANHVADYYGGPLTEQATYDRLYEGVRSRFANHPNVTIVRERCENAVAKMSEIANSEGAFHLIYVDANHSYEAVFDDLMYYKDLVSDRGVFQLNDCSHSTGGIMQNLGVLEAVVKFVKMTDFVPVVLTHTDWSDLLLIRKGNPLIELIDRIIVGNAISFVEVPPQLLGAAKIVSGASVNISFC